MKFYFTLLTLFTVHFISAQIVTEGFETTNMPAEGYLNGSEENGSFDYDYFSLTNSYNSEFMSWSGWAISSTQDTVTEGYTNQYSAIPGEGADNSSNYAVAYTFGNTKLLLNEAVDGHVHQIQITNSTYAYKSMLNGDAFAKKFGGESGDDPDFFLLTIKGIKDGEFLSDSVNFYLADFRFEDNSQDYIVKDWTSVSTHSLAGADELTFSLTSSDVGSFGMNTPAYFCMDNVELLFEVSTDRVQKDDLFSVYPNPTADVLTINSASNKVMTCRIYNSTGNLVLSQQVAAGDQLNLAKLPVGLFYVMLHNDTNYATKTITKM